MYEFFHEIWFIINIRWGKKEEEFRGRLTRDRRRIVIDWEGKFWRSEACIYSFGFQWKWWTSCIVTANDDAVWWGARVSNIDGTASSYELQRACAWVIYFALQLTENRARNIRPLASKGARLATTVRLSLSNEIPGNRRISYLRNITKYNLGDDSIWLRIKKINRKGEIK